MYEEILFDQQKLDARQTGSETPPLGIAAIPACVGCELGTAPQNCDTCRNNPDREPDAEELAGELGVERTLKEGEL